MKEIVAECVFDGGAVLGEGPVWDDRTGLLYWVDIERGRICRFDPKSRSNQEWLLGTRVGFAVLTERGDMIAGTQKGLMRFSLQTGLQSRFANPEKHLPNNRFNDGKCDLQGRLWAGTMSIIETETKGSLYRIDGSEIARQYGPVGISNGLAWSGDSKTFYYIDSPKRRVDAFDFDSQKGEITNARVAFDLDERLGTPDGMCIDAEDMIWVALWGGWGVGRFDPKSGELLTKVRVPVACVTSCCFGGSDFKDLYITTASRDLKEKDREQQAQAGGIFVAHPNVVGTASMRFDG